MEKIFEIREYIRNFYTKYSRYIDLALKFILALLTFAFVNNQVGFFQALSNPAVTFGLSVICTFLPSTLTVIFAAILVLIHFFVLAPGAAVVFGLILIVMCATYFRFAPDKSIVLLITPLAFMMKIPILVPIVYGLIGGPICAIPITFGIIVYFMISYVKSYATVIQTVVAGSDTFLQTATFVQQLFGNKEMWLMIVSFMVCLILVYKLKRLSIERAWEIAIATGLLVNIIMMAFGQVILNISLSYLTLILGSLVTAVIALVVEIFVFSVNYYRTEYLQFEDDEYYYYVKAVPKISVAVPEKTVKKINVRLEQNNPEGSEADSSHINMKKSESKHVENLERELQQNYSRLEEESEIQKIIEKELRN